MAAMYGYEYIKQQIDILMRITILSFNTLVFLQKNTTSSPSAPFSQEASTQTGVCTNIHALDSRYFQCSSFKTKTTTPNQPLESCVSLLRLHKCFTEASKVTGNFQADFFFFFHVPSHAKQQDLNPVCEAFITTFHW